MTDFHQPAYGGGSLADLLPAIGAALGVTEPAPLVLPPAPSYVVFLIDGLGANLLRRYAHMAPYLSSLSHPLGSPGDLTAGVPSSTVTSLTSLGTALLPGTHGVVGYTSRIPGTDRLLNALMWDKAVDPLEWQPHPTAFQTLAWAGDLLASGDTRNRLAVWDIALPAG